MEGGLKEGEGGWKEIEGGWKEMKEWKGVGSRDWSSWKVWGTKIFMVLSNGNKILLPLYPHMWFCNSGEHPQNQ